jgi:hypothetical protein
MLNLRNHYRADAYIGRKDHFAGSSPSNGSANADLRFNQSIEGGFKFGNVEYKFSNSFSGSSSNSVTTWSSRTFRPNITLYSNFPLFLFGKKLLVGESFVSQDPNGGSFYSGKGNLTLDLYPGIKHYRENMFFLSSGDTVGVSMSGSASQSFFASFNSLSAFQQSSFSPFAFFFVNENEISYDFIVLEEDEA